MTDGASTTVTNTFSLVVEPGAAAAIYMQNDQAQAASLGSSNVDTEFYLKVALVDRFANLIDPAQAGYTSDALPQFLHVTHSLGKSISARYLISLGFFELYLTSPYAG